MRKTTRIRQRGGRALFEDAVEPRGNEGANAWAYPVLQRRRQTKREDVEPE